MKKILKLLNTFEIYAGAFCLGVMILLLFLQVFSRYILQHSFSWTEELALIFFILSIYFGATAAVRRNQHLRLEIILNRLNPTNRLILLIIDDLIFIIFNCIIFTGLYTLTKRMYTNAARSAVTNIPKWIIYSFLPFLFMVMNIRLVQDIIAKVKDLKNGPAAAADTTEKIQGE